MSQYCTWTRLLCIRRVAESHSVIHCHRCMDSRRLLLSQLFHWWNIFILGSRWRECNKASTGALYNHPLETQTMTLPRVKCVLKFSKRLKFIHFCKLSYGTFDNFRVSCSWTTPCLEGTSSRFLSSMVVIITANTEKRIEKWIRQG